MKKYIRVMRLDHWIKQLFILPGCVSAILITEFSWDVRLIIKLLGGFFATCLIASSNYVINEYLDAKFDKFHPTKKFRSVVSEGVNGTVIWILWLVLAGAGFVIGYFIDIPFLLTEIWLWIMGVLYNVKPFRTKDVVFLDVLSESVNNAIRLMLGWFIVSANTLPPVSLIFGYWMAGAFLMATKRYAEYRMLGDPVLAASYRKSFRYYSEKSLMISAFFYAMCSVFFIGVFLLKYRVELILFIPLLIGLFCFYFWLSFKEDSAAQKPEKLYHEKGLLLFLLILIVAFVFLMIVDIPGLSVLVSNELIVI